MSVEYETILFRGWEIDEEELEDKSEEFIDLFCEEGFLHWIDRYSDSYPRIFGVETGVSCSCGETYSLDELKNYDLGKDKEKVLCLLAESLFNITTPPSDILALRVY